MKKIEINNTKLNIFTEINELTYKQSVLFQQYFTKILFDVDLQNLEVVYQKFLEHQNKGEHFQATYCIKTFRDGIRMQEPGVDAWMVCFALLCNEENEQNTKTTDVNILIDKFDKLDKLGITTDIVKTEVVNFTRAYSQLSVTYQLKVSGMNNLREFL